MTPEQIAYQAAGYLRLIIVQRTSPHAQRLRMELFRQPARYHDHTAYLGALSCRVGLAGKVPVKPDKTFSFNNVE